MSKLEHSEDVRISTLRQYLEALGARLELGATLRTGNDVFLVGLTPALDRTDAIEAPAPAG